MDFISLFLENLIRIGVIPGLTVTSGLGLSTTGSSLMDADNEGVESLGAISTSLGTSLCLNGKNAYDQTKQQLELTQAYVESLDQMELEELIKSLETKETELSLEEDYGRKLNRHI